MFFTVLCLLQASTSEQSDNTLATCMDHASSKKKKREVKRALDDSGLESNKLQVKRKKHKSLSEGSSDIHNDSNSKYY